MTEEKICKKCGEGKAISCFRARQNKCKECLAIIERARRSTENYKERERARTTTDHYRASKRRREGREDYRAKAKHRRESEEYRVKKIAYTSTTEYKIYRRQLLSSDKYKYTASLWRLKFGSHNRSRARKRGGYVDKSFSRLDIFKRDKFTCEYCKKKLKLDECTEDHRIPIAMGGAHVWENCTTACMPCNRAKHAKLLDGVQITIFDKVKE